MVYMLCFGVGMLFILNPKPYRAQVVWPKAGRYVIFDGQLAHGVWTLCVWTPTTPARASTPYYSTPTTPTRASTLFLRQLRLLGLLRLLVVSYTLNPGGLFTTERIQTIHYTP